MINNSNINSEDKEVLSQSIKLINEHLEFEKARGESAQNRSNILISIIGISATILIALSEKIITRIIHLGILKYVALISICVFLAKALINTLKVLKVKQNNILSPEIINEMQTFSSIKAMQYEVKWKIWEYNQRVPVNTEKLFYLDRAYRNLIFSVFMIFFIGVLMIVDGLIPNEECWVVSLQIVIGFIITLAVVFLDTLFEKNSFWNNSN